MEIGKIRELIADKLDSDSAEIWLGILDDTNPGHYGIQELECQITENNIWVDVPNRSFSFKNASFTFTARLGGSSERNGYDQSFTFTVSGAGSFDFSVGGKDIDIKDFNINEELNLYGE